ncbi:MAG: ribosome maturation factor RimP [Pyrinomonadaceae bacterium MAG19_C2-C3]|nr:ribosome maturation factor RimP [Pyrinomonadaceae bacterium MAG19_C2-C3]
MAETDSSQFSIEARVREVAEGAAGDYGLELVHVEVARSGGRGETIARIFIDKPEGVTHKDCARVSQHVAAVLDAGDFLHGNYTLEVSSPGLERGLYKRGDYERFAGRLAQIKTAKPINSQRNFRGRILGVDADSVVFEDRTNGQVFIPLELIAKGNLEIDAEAEFKIAEERARRIAAERSAKNGETTNNTMGDDIEGGE